MEEKFESIFTRAVAEKMAQILNDIGCENIIIEENRYYPHLNYSYLGVNFQLNICYGLCTVRFRPVDGHINIHWDVRQINTLKSKMEKIIRNGYMRDNV